MTLPVLPQRLVPGNVVLTEYFLILFPFFNIVFGAKLSFFFFLTDIKVELHDKSIRNLGNSLSQGFFYHYKSTL